MKETYRIRLTRERTGVDRFQEFSIRDTGDRIAVWLRKGVVGTPGVESVLAGEDTVISNLEALSIIQSLVTLVRRSGFGVVEGERPYLDIGKEFDYCFVSGRGGFAAAKAHFASVAHDSIAGELARMRHQSGKGYHVIDRDTAYFILILGLALVGIVELRYSGRVLNADELREHCLALAACYSEDVIEQSLFGATIEQHSLLIAADMIEPHKRDYAAAIGFETTSLVL